MRRTTIGMGLAAALFVATGVAARAQDKPPPFQRGPDFQKRVDAAIAKGVAWLRSAQQKDGGFSSQGASWTGGTAVAYLALRVCRTPADDPAAVRAFDAMRREYAAHRAGSDDELSTDEAATHCLALAEHGAPDGARDASGDATCKLNADDAAWMKELVKLIEEMQRPDGSFAYCRDQKQDEDTDSGETSRALLGLRAARRAGVHAKTDTWSRAMQCFFDVQEAPEPDAPRPKGDDAKGPATIARARGFGSPREKRSELSVFDWNVSDGISSVVICRAALSPDPKRPHPLDAKAEQSIRDAVAWLGRDFDDGTTFDVKEALEEGAEQSDYVVAHSIERAGDIAGVERFGEHDWYGMGAEYLIALQDSKGSWGVEHAPKNAEAFEAGEVIDATCSALLFLARGARTGGAAAPPRPLDDADIDFAAAPTLSEKDFDDFLDVVLSRRRRVDDAAAKERLFAKTTAVGPRIVSPLIKRLSSPKDEDRAAAFALLQRATGLAHGYEPSAKPEVRDAAVAAWQAWWEANKDALKYDAASGKLVATK